MNTPKQGFTLSDLVMVLVASAVGMFFLQNLGSQNAQMQELRQTVKEQDAQLDMIDKLRGFSQ